MIAATSIEFFINLAQHDYENQYYDFHNDYSCEKLSYSKGILLILFKSFSGDRTVSLKFTEVSMNVIDFFNVKDAEALTIDYLYRGRFEYNGELAEVSEDGKGYFYLEFYEGQRLEFWANGIDLG